MVRNDDEGDDDGEDDGDDDDDGHDDGDDDDDDMMTVHLDKLMHSRSPPYQQSDYFPGCQSKRVAQFLAVCFFFFHKTFRACRFLHLAHRCCLLLLLRLLLLIC